MWTRRQFLTAYDMAERGMTLNVIAQRVGHTAQEVDLALWRAIGRTVTEALEAINGSSTAEGAGAVVAPARAGAL